MDKYKRLKDYIRLRDEAAVTDCCGKKIIPEADQLTVYTNKHPNTNGSLWGWIEGCTSNVCWSNDSPFDEKAAREYVSSYNTLKNEDVEEKVVSGSRDDIRQLLDSYQCNNTKMDDGNGLGLVDKLVAPGETTISTGLTEIDYLADYLYDNLPTTPAPNKDTVTQTHKPGESIEEYLHGYPIVLQNGATYRLTEEDAKEISRALREYEGQKHTPAPNEDVEEKVPDAIANIIVFDDRVGSPNIKGKFQLMSRDMFKLMPVLRPYLSTPLPDDEVMEVEYTIKHEQQEGE